MENAIHLCFAPDDNYAPCCAVAIASVARHMRPERALHIHILDGGLSEDNRRKLAEIDAPNRPHIHFVKINPAEFTRFHIPSVWYRFKIGSLLPELDRVLYLDCDIVANDALDALFDTDMEGLILAGVKDRFYKKLGPKFGLPKGQFYFNSGVLLMNLKEWRAHKAEEKLFAYIDEDPARISLYDQTILNQLLGGRTKIVDLRWNFQFVPRFIDETCYFSDRLQYRAAAKNPGLVHYIGQYKPWVKGEGRLNPFQPLYYRYLAHTAWRFPDKTAADAYAQADAVAAPRIWRQRLFKRLRSQPQFFFKPYFWGRMFL